MARRVQVGRSLEVLRLLARAVEDGEHFDFLSTHAVGHDERRIGDDKFARAGHPPGAAEMGMHRQQVGLIENARDCGGRVVPGYVVAESFEIAERWGRRAHLRVHKLEQPGHS
jgi:hypothetical protein